MFLYRRWKEIYFRELKMPIEKPFNWDSAVRLFAFYLLLGDGPLEMVSGQLKFGQICFSFTYKELPGLFIRKYDNFDSLFFQIVIMYCIKRSLLCTVNII